MGKKRKQDEETAEGVAGGGTKKRPYKRKAVAAEGDGHCDVELHAKVGRNRASPCQITKLYEWMTDDQKAAVTDMELDSVLGIKCDVLHGAVINWFASTYDKNTREFVIPGRGRIPLDERSVFRSLGLPNGDQPVPYAFNSDIQADLGPRLFPEDGDTPLTTRLYEILKAMTNHDNAFKQIFVMYAMSTFICPTTRNRASNRCYPVMGNINNCKHLNWSKFVADQLHEGLSNGQYNKNCLFLLELLYVDSIDVSGLNIDLPDERFAINMWSKKNIEIVLAADLQNDGKSYGKLPLKTCFGINHSLFGGLDGFNRWINTCSDPGCSAKRKTEVSHLMGTFASGIVGLMGSLVGGWTKLEADAATEMAHQFSNFTHTVVGGKGSSSRQVFEDGMAKQRDDIGKGAAADEPPSTQPVRRVTRSVAAAMKGPISDGLDEDDPSDDGGGGFKFHGDDSSYDGSSDDDDRDPYVIEHRRPIRLSKKNQSHQSGQVGEQAFDSPATAASSKDMDVDYTPTEDNTATEDTSAGFADTILLQASAHSSDIPLADSGSFARDESSVPDYSAPSNEIPPSGSQNFAPEDTSVTEVSGHLDDISLLAEAAAAVGKGDNPAVGVSTNESPVPRFKKQGVYTRRRRLRSFGEKHNEITGVVLSELQLTAASMRRALPCRIGSKRAPMETSPKKMTSSRKSVPEASVKPTRVSSRLRAKQAPSGSGTTSFVDLGESSPVHSPTADVELDAERSPDGGLDSAHAVDDLSTADAGRDCSTSTGQNCESAATVIEGVNLPVAGDIAGDIGNTVPAAADIGDTDDASGMPPTFPDQVVTAHGPTADTDANPTNTEAAVDPIGVDARDRVPELALSGAKIGQVDVARNFGVCSDPVIAPTGAVPVMSYSIRTSVSDAGQSGSQATNVAAVEAIISDAAVFSSVDVPAAPSTTRNYVAGIENPSSSTGLHVDLGLDSLMKKKIDEESAKNGGFFSASLLFPSIVSNPMGPTITIPHAAVTANPHVPSTVLHGHSGLDDDVTKKLDDAAAKSDVHCPASAARHDPSMPEWNFGSQFDSPVDDAPDVGHEAESVQNAGPSAAGVDAPPADCNSIVKIIEAEDALPLSYALATSTASAVDCVNGKARVNPESEVISLDDLLMEKLRAQHYVSSRKDDPECVMIYSTPAPAPQHNIIDVPSVTPRTVLRRGRVIQPSKFLLPPYSCISSSKDQNDLYQKVIIHGNDKKLSKLKGTRILHIDPMWVTAGELADSMKPGAELSNTVAEIGITVLQKCCVDKKVIFPWVITSQLLNGNFDSKLVKLHFRRDGLYQLSHKNLLCFAVLQKFRTGPNASGHWYVLSLNLVAKKFEILDSLRGHADQSMIEHATRLVRAIKKVWIVNYASSSKQIEDYELVYIDVPKQGKDTLDCGFFMLKFLELWDGRVSPAITHDQIPELRKVLTAMWLEHADNKLINWKSLLDAHVF